VLNRFPIALAPWVLYLHNNKIRGAIASVIRYRDARVLCNRGLDESQVKSQRHEWRYLCGNGRFIGILVPPLRKGLRDVGEIIAQTQQSRASNNAGTITRSAFAFANNGGHRADTMIGEKRMELSQIFVDENLGIKRARCSNRRLRGVKTQC